MTEIMRPFFLCGKGSQIFPRTWVFSFLETKLGYMLPILLNLLLEFLCIGLLENTRTGNIPPRWGNVGIFQYVKERVRWWWGRQFVRFALYGRRSAAGKGKGCVYSSAKINLLFRIEEVFAKQFSDFLRTVVIIDKNKWTFFRMLSCFVSFLASFGGKRAPFSSRSVGGCPSRV